MSESSSYFNSAWSYLNTHSPNWESNAIPNTNPSQSYDPFPWAILGYVTAKRSGTDTTKAQTQVSTIEALFGSHPELVTINELGFYLRAKAYL